ncbi:unnamed protein product [Clonostachys byssicola]|uniref:AAA+ ATPase domain-containing protein n=1 Tax=Clonostachys byssicola TaxID=160290 RepID=A0A9N9UBB1_9HYPO|nr:unnamed protein product [Clonostachys byssicola]
MQRSTKSSARARVVEYTISEDNTGSAKPKLEAIRGDQIAKSANSENHPADSEIDLTQTTSSNPEGPDYQMQLMLLEQQNKKRLLLARQEQDRIASKLGAGRVTPSPDSSSLPVKNSSRRGASSGNTISVGQTTSEFFDWDKWAMERTLSRLPFSGQPDVSEMSSGDTTSLRQLEKAQSQHKHNSFTLTPQFRSTEWSKPVRSSENLAHNPPNMEPGRATSESRDFDNRALSVNAGSSGEWLTGTLSTHSHAVDSYQLQQMALRIQELESQLSQFHSPLKEQIEMNVQVFHCLEDVNEDGPFVKGIYLSEPEWEIYEESIRLKSHSLIPDADAYIKNRNAVFVIYHYYDENRQIEDVHRALNAHELIPRPRSYRQSVSITSKEMRESIELAFKKHCAEFQSGNITVLDSPFSWWYHVRGCLDFQHLSHRQAQLVGRLTEWIELTYGTLYDRVKDQLQRGMVSNMSMPYLIKVGDVLVSDIEHSPKGKLAKSSPSPSEGIYHDDESMPRQSSKSERKQITIWSITVRSYRYAQDFYWDSETLSIQLPGAMTENIEIEIANLKAVPLQYAPTETRDLLHNRGETFWKCRRRRLVSYEQERKDGAHARCVVDFSTYMELHPFQQHTPSGLDGSMKVKDLPKDDTPPDAPGIYLFPRIIPGFDLRTKKWIDLNTDRIRDVTWNDKAFKSLVADEDMKEVILALVTNQLESEKGTDLIDNKGNGLIMLLHGPPGTGKTFTAESVAEIAKKPLYAVTCGDIGTKPEQVEKYLQSVFYLGKIWNCVVLLDEAEVFLEQRSLQDLERNALVSVFLRSLEYYDGILILTTNRVGSFDEAFKSRIQLALRYYALEAGQRKQIWRNFFHRLEELGEDVSIDFDDIRLHIEELADYPMNGRQIRNSITTGRQLAKYMNKKMTFAHLKKTITLANKFDRYLADVRETEVEESTTRGVDGRYTDEFWARSDGVR